MTILADHDARRDILDERGRNVIVDAGAGTGKTETIVSRFVGLLSVIPIHRIAAITFTRRAAGELKYRIRERILTELGASETAETRKHALRQALGGLDGAYIGTIHSFADRLLRLRPVEAGISPRYAIEEDTETLERRAVERLLLAAERGDCEPLSDAVEGGLPLRTTQMGPRTALGLDSLLAGLIAKRDVRLSLPLPVPPDLSMIADLARGSASDIRRLAGASRGVNALKKCATDYDRVASATEPRGLLKAVLRLERFFPKDLKKGDDFQKDGAAWDLYKRLRDESNSAISQSAKDWIAGRLAGLGGIAASAYEDVKREREVVDQTDLLLKFRGVLAQEPHRRYFAGLFDHLLVDEFQDTDPIQAQILTELVRTDDGRNARPGVITIVGDAKQSIYRFRRADIEAYDRFRGWLTEGGALVHSLRANFRSTGPIIEFVNDRFTEIMGPVRDGVVFDVASGRTFYERLESTVAGTSPGVHLVPIAGAGGWALGAEEGRAIEADALAAYLKHLSDTGFQVRGQDGEASPMRWGDVAVLGVTTTCWPLYFDAFSRLGIPFAARGGSVFARDPHVRSLILALRAISDPDDGVAHAAYFRPPFWPLSLDDIVGEGEPYMKAREVLHDLRAGRASLPPATTARQLLERSRAMATLEGGPNGARAMAQAEELVQIIDGVSREGLDFDAVTREIRGWIDAPPKIDAPEPVGEDVVRFLSIHQAKGLEFPVVVLADAFQERSMRVRGAWIVNSAGTAACVRLDGLEGEVPAGSGVVAREEAFADAEMERLAYVGTTRARDLLVLAAPVFKMNRGYLFAPLTKDRPGLTLRVDAYQPDRPPAWASSATPVPAFRAMPAIGEPWRDSWEAGLANAIRPVASPTPITKAAAAPEEADEATTSPRFHREEARHGRVFGTTVHRALQLALAGASGPPRELVQRAAQESGLTEHLDEALADVERTLTALKGIPGEKYAEFPLARLLPDGRLLEGFADVVCVAEEVLVIDFKTDVPPDGDGAALPPVYAEQVRLYGQAIAESHAFGALPIRRALLFTATGSLREVPAQ